MGRVNGELSFTPRQERRLLKAAAAAVPAEFPNPDRCGCPAPEKVRRLARRRIALAETGDLVDHIATCAPCFDAYKRYRRQRRAAQIAAPALAALIASLGLALLWRYEAVSRLDPRQQIAHAPVVPVISASVDYRKISPTRSADPQPNRAGTPSLKRARLNLTILLPFGMDDGGYAVEIRDASGVLVAKGAGVSQWKGTAEALTVKLDLRQVPAGTYILAIRRGDESWRSYPLILEQGK